MTRPEVFTQFKIKKDAKLAPLSTFKIGGVSEYLAIAETPEKFVDIAEWAKKNKMPLTIFAGGSNTVFPDGKLKGLVLRFFGGKISFQGKECVADGGVLLGEVVKRSIGRGLSGLETLSGIPGTVGGAVVGNAGAYGHSIAEIVKSVEIWDGKKKRWISKRECNFAYRQSVFKERQWLVLRIRLGFKAGNAAALRRISRHIIAIREKKYKPGIKCPGSFFKNVLAADVPRKSLERIDRSKIIDGKIPAGYLLESVGSKGMRVGGIEIASFHGNLFVNKGRAKAADVRKLANILRKKVHRKFGILLEEEVRYVQ
ncbi:UDP-N-acetylmuramate dehydrogenase [Patescibacteria group bacterium]|nr:UDP-N-acetylmuramate dehydrogenase [Patescibacteria group bacterium]MCL5114330.1 UDP-N-acetylmuramate dehydrogenase [Patescibacteria group bacterium]